MKLRLTLKVPKKKTDNRPGQVIYKRKVTDNDVDNDVEQINNHNENENLMSSIEYKTYKLLKLQGRSGPKGSEGR